MLDWLHAAALTGGEARLRRDGVHFSLSADQRELPVPGKQEPAHG